MSQDLVVIAENIDGSIKIRDYLIKRLGFSVSLIAKVKYGNVFLNGSEVHMRALVKNGDTIKVSFPEEESENIEPINIPLDILYEDRYILAVNKPVNMPVHPSKGNHLPTLANAVRAYINGPFVFRAINRLDRDTSGIVLIAKDQLTSAKLSSSMKEKRFIKKYLALVVGKPEQNEGIIDAPIEREFEGSIKRIVTEKGKSCQTYYKLMSTDKNGNSLCEVMPLTGRTHQIRVHMAHIGHPLYNDFLYGSKIQDGTYFLHCCELSFPHPQTNEPVTVSCEPNFKQVYEF